MIASLQPKEQQIGFSDLAAQKALKKVRNHPLLRIKEKFPFDRFREILTKLYSQNGRPGFDPVKMLCLLLLGKLQNLSDKRLETDVTVNLLYREFCGWGMDDDTPDHSTLSRFRDRIAPVWPEIWAEMLDWLRENRLLNSELLIIDATDIKAQGRFRKPPDSGGSSSEDKYAKQTDPDARHGYKKKDKPFFGYKSHVITDAKSDMVVAIETTPGNVHDGVMLPKLVPRLRYKPFEVSADKIYWSLTNRRFLLSQGIADGIIPNSKTPGPRKLAHLLRKRIERINSLLKCMFGLARTRFFGLKNVDLDQKLGGFAVNLVNLLRTSQM